MPSSVPTELCLSDVLRVLLITAFIIIIIGFKNVF